MLVVVVEMEIQVVLHHLVQAEMVEVDKVDQIQMEQQEQLTQVVEVEVEVLVLQMVLLVDQE
jgi:hypothetical protein